MFEKRGVIRYTMSWRRRKIGRETNRIMRFVRLRRRPISLYFFLACNFAISPAKPCVKLLQTPIYTNPSKAEARPKAAKLVVPEAHLTAD